MNPLQTQIHTDLQNAIREVRSASHALARLDITPEQAKEIGLELADFAHEIGNIQTVYYGISEKILTSAAIREYDAAANAK